MEWDAAGIRQWLKKANAGKPTHRAAIGRALLYLYGLQTADEQETRFTKHQNGQGFNSHDAELLTGIAKGLQAKGELTTTQAHEVKYKLIKYAGQLEAWVQ